MGQGDSKENTSINADKEIIYDNVDYDDPDVDHDRTFSNANSNIME